MGTWRARAARCRTDKVGLASPDSRWLQVALGNPASFAICSCVRPRDSRSCRRLAASLPASSLLMPTHYLSANILARMLASWRDGRRLDAEVEAMRIQAAAALVTGGSRGLGAALGRALAREGARVVLVARGARELEAAAQGTPAAGGEAHALAGDVGGPRAASALAGAAGARPRTRDPP